MRIFKDIKRLIRYGIEKGLIDKEDEIYARNRMLEILGLDDYQDVEVPLEALTSPQPILDDILDYAYENGILVDNTVTYRDLFDTRIMDCLLPRPSEVVKKFYEEYERSPRLATDFYYKLSQASNYIRTDRTEKDLRWKTGTDYGELDITINLAKPEKDPKAIAAAKNLKSATYPKCLLCKENEGYAGRIDHPARQNHRVVPIELCGEVWFFQYSPYVYYNEHCIVFSDSHEPMKISNKTFERLLAFVERFPHYFIGSNADLPIVGGSILSHDHFQGGCYEFAMEKAPFLQKTVFKGFEDVDAGIIKWPMSVMRIRCERKERLIALAGSILDAWRGYSDESAGIRAFTGTEPHNTITPIARYKNGRYELDLVLRNNRTDEAHLLGIFHPHSDVHHIKKENIGLIEVMGLAVLPARLLHELALLKDCLAGIKVIDAFEELEQHRLWFGYLKNKYPQQGVDFDAVLRCETGKKFERVLWDAGVFKQDSTGLEAFARFIRHIEGENGVFRG